VLEELCLIEFIPEVVRLELCEALEMELDKTLVGVDALFVELEILLDELELKVFFVEVDTLRLDTEPLGEELTTSLVELGIILLEVEAIFVATGGFVLELDPFLPELKTVFVELELFSVELDDTLVALDGFLEELESTFVDVDARFTELEVLLVGLLDLELVVFFVEPEDARLVSLEPRVGFTRPDELETLLDDVTLCFEDDVCLELADPFSDTVPFVEVVGCWEAFSLTVQIGDPSVTEVFLLEVAFFVEVLTIRPLLVTRAVLLLFDELLLDDFCVGRNEVDNARRGNIIFLEVEDPDGDDWSSKENSAADWSTEDPGNQPSSLCVSSWLWSMLERNDTGMSTIGTNFLNTSNRESFLAPDASTSECLRRVGWTWSLEDWTGESSVATPDKDDKMRPPDSATP
jgi:hypothetical protein